MRVCDGSCRRLSRLCRRQAGYDDLVRALDEQAAACAQAGRDEWKLLMQRAADALRHTAKACCGEGEDAGV